MDYITVYRCQRQCPIHKNCFILKTDKPIKEKISVLYKCSAEKKDIKMTIGGHDQPP